MTQYLQHPLHDSSGMCKVHDGHFVIMEWCGRVHLINDAGVFQKFLLQPDDGIVQLMSVCFDASTEQPRLFLACMGHDAEAVQINIYDYEALLAEKPLINLFDELDGEGDGKRNHLGNGEFQQGRQQSNHSREQADPVLDSIHTSFRERNIQQDRGLLQTFKLENCRDSVRRLSFLPALECVCVALTKSSTVRLFTLEGSALGSFDARSSSDIPIDMLALKTQSTSLIVSRPSKKALGVVKLARTSSQQLEASWYVTWKLNVIPSALSSFKSDMFLVLDNSNLAVHIFTEMGQQLDSITIREGLPAHVNPDAIIADAKGFWVSIKGHHHGERPQSSVLRINPRSGKVARRYDGKEPLLDAAGICEVHGGHVAISDFCNCRVHLISPDGMFQRFLLQKDDGIVHPTSLHYDTSREQAMLFLGSMEGDCAQVQIYDYNVLVAEEPAAGLLDEPKTDDPLLRSQESPK